MNVSKLKDAFHSVVVVIVAFLIAAAVYYANMHINGIEDNYNTSLKLWKTFYNDFIEIDRASNYLPDKEKLEINQVYFENKINRSYKNLESLMDDRYVNESSEFSNRLSGNLLFDIKSNYIDYTQLIRERIKFISLLPDSSNPDEYKRKLSKLKVLNNEVNAKYRNIKDSMISLEELLIAKKAHQTSYVSRSLTILGVILVLVALLLSYFVYKLRLRIALDKAEAAKSMASYEKRIQLTSEFVKKVSLGDFDAFIDANTDDDELFVALNQMKNRLKASTEEDKRRNWIATGLAEIGSILRSDLGEKDLYNKIISYVVKYTNSNQGGLFLVSDDGNNKWIELVAAYAYEKKKYIEKRIEINEGLVGQAYLEGEMIFMTDVPQNYVHITSGLGEATPNCLVLMPLKVNQQINGVLELASFNVYETYQLEFISKIAESIAGAINSLRVNAQTLKLLKQTQQQAEEMRAQEEELRQNLEEMQATQEEMDRLLRESKRKQAELDARIALINEACLVSETDLKGNITFVNDKFCEVAKYTREELIGKPHNIVRHPDMPKEVFKEVWATIGRGKIFRGEVKNRAKDGSAYWVDAIIGPVLGENGKPIRYIGVRYDITAQKKIQEELEAKVRESQIK